MDAPEKAAPIPAEDAPYCAGSIAHIDISGLCERHVRELRRHAEKLLWQMENDERPAPPHGWTCFHCAQTFTTWASASAHFGDDPRRGLAFCVRSDAEAAIRFWAEGPCDNIEDLIAAVRSALGDSQEGHAREDAQIEAQTLDDWHEDCGCAVWWAWKDGQWLGEPAWIGTPNDSDWPGYHTHWTPHPSFPAAPQEASS